MADDTSFPYQPLQDASTHIRLLQIKPEESDDVITCTLSAHEIENAPPYTAISYTWGERVPTKRLILDGFPISVRANSFYALWQVRHHEMKNDDSLMWFDNLVGNSKLNTDGSPHQPHLASGLYITTGWMLSVSTKGTWKKKGHQVQVMGKIFGNATDVAVSLGRATISTTFLFKSLQNSPHDDDPDAWEDWLSETEKQLGWQHIARLGRALIDMGVLRYWSRLWIVQELLMARRATLLCGLGRFDWSHTLDFVREMTVRVRDLKFFNKFAVTKSREEEYHNFLEELESMRLQQIVQLKDKSRRTGARSYELQDLLQSRGTWQCANVLDNIYAILYLLRNGAPESQVKPILVDYTKSAFELAMETFDHLFGSVGMSGGDQKAGWTRALLDVLRIDYSHPDIRRMIEFRQENYRIWLEEDTCQSGFHRPTPQNVLNVVNDLIKSGVVPAGYHEIYAKDYGEHTNCFRLKRSSGGHLSTSTVFHDDLGTELDLSIAYDAIQSSWPQTPELQAVKQGSTTVALLCGRTEPGDWVIPFDRMMGRVKDERFYGCLVVRPHEDPLFEIIGQGLMEPLITYCMPYTLCERCTSMRSAEVPAMSFRLFFCKEDLVAFGAQDLTLDRTTENAFASPERIKQDLDRVLSQPSERLRTSVTRSRFSSFAICSPITAKTRRRSPYMNMNEEHFDLAKLHQLQNRFRNIPIKVITNGNTGAQVQTFIDVLSKRQLIKPAEISKTRTNMETRDHALEIKGARRLSADHGIGTIDGKPVFGPKRPPPRSHNDKR